MISIIMPTYNKSSFLKLTLAGFTMQTEKDFEIVLVNDGSTDDTEEVVEKYIDLLNIKYIKTENRGRSAARNTALEEAIGEYLLFCDDDRIPDKNFVKSHSEFLLHHPDKISIGMKKEVLSLNIQNLPIRATKYNELYKREPKCFDAIVLRNEYELIKESDIFEDIDGTLNKWNIGTAKDNQSRIYEKWGDDLKDFEFGWTLATTANIGLKREAYENIRFEEDYNGWGMEDTDYAYKLYRKGAKFQYLPEAVNYHQMHVRAEDAYSQLRENVRIFAKKNPQLEAYFFVLSFKYVFDISEGNRLFQEIQRNVGDDIRQLVEKMAAIISQY